jgi:uncharacterized membrane protein
VVIVAALLLWVVMGAIGFALYKARRTPMLATVPSGVWMPSLVIGSVAVVAMVVAVVASSERPDWGFAAIVIGVYLVAAAVVWLAIRAARRRSD